MKKNPGKYLLNIFILPLVLSFVILPLLTAGGAVFAIMLVLFALAGLLAGIHLGGKPQGTTFQNRYLPVAAPVLFTAFLATIFMVVSKGFSGHPAWPVFSFMMFPFLPYSFFAALMAKFMLSVLAPFLYYFFLLMGYFIAERRSETKVNFSQKGTASIIGAVLLFAAISGGVVWERSKHVLPSYGFEYENGYSSVDLFPYTVTNPDHILPNLNETASFTIKNQNEMPILDGAEAAFPVYSAFANAIYQNIGAANLLDNGKEIVAFTNTIYAFEQLVTGEVDIFFGAQPSAAQQKLAEESGKELVLTPIGKEAFVFFVNEKNEINSLTADEIKNIYSGKITNWKELGGARDDIVAFQRPADSGSQTIMEKFMGETPLIKPLKEEVAGMGDVMEQVANYRNYQGSIGYSFRFFTTGMNPNSKIKLLSLNGIEPSAENIANGNYPYVVNLYAITVKDNPKKTIQHMLDWMQGPQGQKLVGDVGYIPLD